MWVDGARGRVPPRTAADRVRRCDRCITLHCRSSAVSPRRATVARSLREHAGRRRTLDTLGSRCSIPCRTPSWSSMRRAEIVGAGTTATKHAGGAWPALALCATHSSRIANRTAPANNTAPTRASTATESTWSPTRCGSSPCPWKPQRGPFVLRVMSCDFAINGASTSAPGLVTSSRQHSTANSRPTSTPASACCEKRSVTYGLARYAPNGRPPRRKTPKIEIRGTPPPVITGAVPVQVVSQQAFNQKHEVSGGQSRDQSEFLSDPLPGRKTRCPHKSGGSASHSRSIRVHSSCGKARRVRTQGPPRHPGRWRRGCRHRGRAVPTGPCGTSVRTQAGARRARRSRRSRSTFESGPARPRRMNCGPQGRQHEEPTRCRRATDHTCGPSCSWSVRRHELTGGSALSSPGRTYGATPADSAIRSNVVVSARPRRRCGPSRAGLAGRALPPTAPAQPSRRPARSPSCGCYHSACGGLPQDGNCPRLVAATASL